MLLYGINKCLICFVTQKEGFHGTITVTYKNLRIHVALLTLFKPGFFYLLKIQGGSLGTPLMISGTIKASPMKLCTVIVLLKAYQNTKRNCQKNDLWRHNYVITENIGKIPTSTKPDKFFNI